MNLQRTMRVANRWWPAPIAVIVLLAHLGTWYYNAVHMLAVLVICVGIATARAWPLPSFAVTSLGAFVAAFVSDTASGWLLLTTALAAALLATWGVDPLSRRLLLGIPAGVIAAVALVTLGTQAQMNGYGHVSQWEGMFAWGFAVVAWAAVVGGRALRDFVRAESSKQQAVARTTVVESELRDERLRADLTHDFHDVMAHSLAVLAAQAEGLRLSHKQHPERIDPVLTTISDTARLALVEVRQLLERVDDDARRPQPTSADIPGLVAQLRSAGPRVALHDIGAHGHLSRLADIAAYRIVQESLTNALRHGGADIDIVVALTWTGPGLSIAIASPIHDRAALKPAGRGIAGMHERARLAGGAVEIDADGERFVVSAYLPYEPISHEPTPPLTEEQLFTLPVPKQQRPEDVVAPWIVEATRLHRLRHPENQTGAQPTTPYPTRDWSQATTVDLTDARLPDGRIRNPMAPDETPR
ncbi:sensor histidine kinase [Agrococcus sp. KRD186]|uniref:sensor histidine kinase n=1 Tax=Agrococcus sp. KRD186 TaxID=2729730 RepID=UPI0019D13B06|nr:histidine kinase [Agrococcus sp. KRD186]